MVRYRLRAVAYFVFFWRSVLSHRFSRRTETFIVRFWIEYLEQTPPAWRGEIEHVSGGEVLRFHDWEEMSAEIRRWVLAQREPDERK
jgi:hypothetical protein